MTVVSYFLREMVLLCENLLGFIAMDDAYGCQFQIAKTYVIMMILPVENIILSEIHLNIGCFRNYENMDRKAHLIDFLREQKFP